MGDYLWLGAVGVVVVAVLAVAALGHALDRRAKREMFRRLRRDDEYRGREAMRRNAPRIPVQLVRESPPLNEPKVIGRIGRRP